VRFSYIPPDSIILRRYRCQPDTALFDRSTADQLAVLRRLVSTFTSRRYGQPAYGQLLLRTAQEILTGAENRAELGAFSEHGFNEEAAMKGDFSHLVLVKKMHFTGVLSQQGRVLLDSEQNEALTIAAHLRETSLTQIIGPSGVPLSSPDAFKISGFSSNDFSIQAGQMYVDGILVECDISTTINGQPNR
jgi:hypothetical protein